MKYVLPTHLAATLFMVGVVWFVQVVHYSLFVKASWKRFVLCKARSRLPIGNLDIPGGSELLEVVHIN